MRWVATLLCAVTASCGSTAVETDDAGGSIPPVDLESPATTTTAPPETSTVVPPPSTLPSPDDVMWLSTPDPIDGVRLTAATRELVADCGPDGNCPGTIPQATLVFDKDDLADARTIVVTQFFDAFEIAPVERTTGEERTIGARTVTITSQGTGDTPHIAAGWDEPDGYAVEIRTTGMTIDAVEAIIESLVPTEPDQWPLLDVSEPVTPCVDESTRYAPAIIPDGWNRFVLDASPTGTCNVSTVLFMSLVEPGTEQAPGTLVTFVTMPASATTAQPGEAIEIDGRPAVVQESTGPDGRPQTAIYLTIGAVVVDGHGNVDRTTLEELMATIVPFDEPQWAALVDEIEQ